MNNVLSDLQEYVVIGTTLKPISSQPQVIVRETNESTSVSTIVQKNSLASTDYKWSVNETKILIDSAKFRKKVGTFDIRNVKQMWEKIAAELTKLHNINVTSDKCNNRWEVLERNYKKFVDDQNKTGRGRKFFEYQTEMEEIFGKKKNVHPEIFLSSTTVNNSLEEGTIEVMTEEILERKENKNEVPKTPVTSLKSPAKASTKTQTIKRKMSTIEKMRLDRKSYYDAKLETERQKLLEIQKRKKIVEQRN